ncbi:MAG TPA: riboflavin synthase [Trichocoleus sp.]
MFTGLVRTIGRLRPLSTGLVQITCDAVGAEAILDDLELGDSIAVDGVCLTVTEILSRGFTAAISPETIDRTTLGREAGEVYVNLEPSLRVGSKLGGHFVTGHIDGIGYLDTSVQTANAWEMSFRVSDSRVSRYIVPKGSIAVNGISLTVADCSSIGSWFKVAVIPLTYAETNLRFLQSGSPVNLEGDVLGKYVEKFVRLGMRDDRASVSETDTETTSYLSPAFLAEHGYL